MEALVAFEQALQGLFVACNSFKRRITKDASGKMLCISRNHERKQAEQQQQQPRLQIEVNKSKLSLKELDKK